MESMADADEMEIAVRAACEAAGVPVVASMTYNRTPKGYRTMMGNTPEACVRKAESAGAALIGANCGTGIEDYVPLAPVLRGLTELPVWVKANAGVPQIVAGKVTFPLTPEQYASFVPALVADRRRRDRRLLRHRPPVHPRGGQEHRPHAGALSMAALFVLFCALFIFIRGESSCAWSPGCGPRRSPITSHGPRRSSPGPSSSARG